MNGKNMDLKSGETTVFKLYFILNKYKIILYI